MLFTLNHGPGVHIVYTQAPLCTSYCAFSPARGIVVEAIDHGTITVHQNRPAISILLVRLHPDTEQEHHAPVPAILVQVVQVMGDFIPEVFQGLMFSDVIGVCQGRLGCPNLFAQGCKPIVFAMVVTAMQSCDCKLLVIR
jgi:hypothetical protein